MLHSAGGIGGYITDWEQFFLATGIATFVIDSYSARGVVNTPDDQSQLGRLVQAEGAYRALELLEKHPRIDPDKMILMRFFHGGVRIQCAVCALLSAGRRVPDACGRRRARSGSSAEPAAKCARPSEGGQNDRFQGSPGMDGCMVNRGPRRPRCQRAIRDAPCAARGIRTGASP